MQGLLAGLLVLSVTYFGGKGLLQRFFFRTGYVYAEETERAEELQEYVTQNKLSASDYKMLKKWGTERNIDDFTISRGKWLYFLQRKNYVWQQRNTKSDMENVPQNFI